MVKNAFIGIAVSLVLIGCELSENESDNDTTLQAKYTSKAELGKELYSDTSLSLERTMSCATCHSLEHGFSDPRSNSIGGALSVGDDGVAFGGRNAPTAGYAQLSPRFQYSSENGFFGGQFHDGRANGLKGQAKGPFLDTAEMMMPNEAAVITRVEENSDYINSFKVLYGNDIFDDTTKAYDALADSIAQFEMTETFAPFDSKYDRYLKGEANLTIEEDAGMTLFFSESNTNCNSCHMLKSALDTNNEPFSNFAYENIGVPKNLAALAAKGLPSDTVDHGILGRDDIKNRNDINQTRYDGAFKVPTLRNVAVTGPYMHNGVFKKLETVLAFYDHMAGNGDHPLNPETNASWGEADVPASINHQKLRATKALTDKKIEHLVAFLKTLTDKKFEHLINE